MHLRTRSLLFILLSIFNVNINTSANDPYSKDTKTSIKPLPWKNIAIGSGILLALGIYSYYSKHQKANKTAAQEPRTTTKSLEKNDSPTAQTISPSQKTISSPTIQEAPKETAVSQREITPETEIQHPTDACNVQETAEPAAPQAPTPEVIESQEKQLAEKPLEVSSQQSEEKIIPGRAWSDTQDLQAINNFLKQTTITSVITTGKVGNKGVVLVQTDKMADKKQKEIEIRFPSNGDEIYINYACLYTGDIGHLTIGYMSSGRSLKVSTKNYDYTLKKEADNQTLRLTALATAPVKISHKSTTSFCVDFITIGNQEFLALVIDYAE